jgi:hypothetical protein
MWRSHSSCKRVQIYRDKIVADAVDDAVRPSVIMRHDSDAVDKSIASEAVSALGAFLTRGLSSRQQVTCLLFLCRVCCQVSNPHATMIDYVSFWFETKYGLATVAQEAAAKLAGGVMFFRRSNNAYCDRVRLRRSPLS